MKNPFTIVFRLQMTMAIAWLIGFFGVGIATWIFAPPVGGEFWPYIRVGASLLAGFVGAKISVFIFVPLALGFIGIKSGVSFRD